MAAQEDMFRDLCIGDKDWRVLLLRCEGVVALTEAKRRCLLMHLALPRPVDPPLWATPQTRTGRPPRRLHARPCAVKHRSGASGRA